MGLAFDDTHAEELIRIVGTPDGTLRHLSDLRAFREAEPWDAASARRQLETRARRTGQTDDFTSIRLAELHDGLVLDHDDVYVLAMISLPRTAKLPNLREFLLRHDEDLRENVFWRIFEVEGGGEVSLTKGDPTWQRTVLALVADGTLERSRVLRCCLEALTRDFSSYRAGWFSRMWTALEPSVEETARDQDLLLRCLGTGITATVSLAIKQLARLAKAGLLDGSGFVAAAAPALTAGKATVLATLRLLEPQPEAAEVVALGLTHEHVDVQRAVVASLKRLGREDLADAGGLSPVVAAEIGVEMNPAETRQATAVVDRPARPVVPFTDEDALERVAALVEDGGDPVELELALAWFAGTESPGERLAPLRKRVKGALTPVLRAAFDLPPEVGVEPWPFGEVPAVPSSVAQALWHQRIAEVAAIVAGKDPRRPLLATPSDSHGFVEGSDFLDRLSQARASLGAGEDLRLRCPGDLVQAGFRLTEPDRLRAEQVLGFLLPRPSSRLDLEWVGKESDERKPNGEPEVIWWRARMSCEPEPTQPHPVEEWNHLNGDVLPFALVDPNSTAYLVAATIETAMFGVTDFPLQVPRALTFLREQNGHWSPETAQLLALAMSAQRTETRTLAAELLAESIPGRLGAAETAEGMAATVMLCKVNRWASSLSDAASINAGSVIDLLTALLPRLDRGLRGIGGVMQVLLDEQLRLGRVTEDETLREWLAGFTGSSAAARCAKTLLAAVP